MDLGVSGLASGFDWKTLVEQLADVERVPQTRLRSEQNVIQQRNNAYGSILTQLGVLQNRITALKEPTLFDARLASVGDSKIASATVSEGAALGTYTFDFVQLATTSKQQGAANIGRSLNTTNDVSALALGNASFARAATAGMFTVNGKQVTIAASDTLQQVFDKISTATSGAVTGSYDHTTDQITLSASGTITLGSAADTSNFLTVAKLYNNGTGTVTSTSALGGIKQSAILSSGNFSATISDGGSGTGEFKINGVSITFDVSNDSLQNVIDRINDSTAGVAASYDVVNDRLTLMNKSTGDLGVALEDVTGNFLAASGLSSGTLLRGNNLIYTINGGSQLISQSNTITEASSGLTGVSVTALKEDTTTVTVSSDTAKIKTAITDFITEYNNAQSLLDTQTASSTDAKGKVTAGVLAGESDANELARKLRSLVNSVASGLSDSITSLSKLGINSNGTDDKIAVSDSSKLDDALANSLTGMKELFTDATEGLAVTLDSYLEATIGDDGTLVTKQDNLTKSAGDIDTQITEMERIVQSNRERMILSFISMERAQAQISQQLSFLQQRMGIS